MVICSEIMGILPENIKIAVAGCVTAHGELQEIRLRVHEWIILVCNGKEYVITDSEGGVKLTSSDMRECFKRISEYSVYAYEEEIRQGYITINGGHRIGIAGRAVIKDGHIQGIRHVTYINIRVAAERRGCADKVLKYIYGNKGIENTLIVSLPGGGKTTLLRDIVRQISDGNRYMSGVNVGVVDERSEICACYRGIPQNDVGMRTDVLDACPKAEGIIRLVRSMSPSVIAVDEIGTEEDIKAVEYAYVSGCKTVATIHGADMESICRNRLVARVVEREMFGRYIFLDGIKRAGVIGCIRDGRGGIVYDGS